MSYSTHQSVTSFTLNLPQGEVEAQVSNLIYDLSYALLGVFEDWSNTKTKTESTELDLLLPLADQFSTSVYNLSSVLDTGAADLAADENDLDYLTDAFKEVLTLRGNKVSLATSSEEHGGEGDCFSDLLADALLPLTAGEFQVRTFCWNDSGFSGSNTVVVTKNGEDYSIADLVALLPG
jgi:hypothetical protein